MKKILAILVVIFMHLSAIPQDGTSWVQQYLVLFQQIANAEDENKITEIAQQLIDLLQPIYTNYSKDAYNDGMYERICTDLIDAYCLSGQYKFAKDIVDATIKRIKDDAIKLELSIRNIKIIGLLGSYKEAERLCVKVAPIINRYIAELQDHTDLAKAISTINAIVEYDTAISILQIYYQDEIDKIIPSCEYEKAINMLQQKELLFTSTLLSNKTLAQINKYTSRVLKEYSTNSIPLEQEGRMDPCVFYYTQLAYCHTQLGQYSVAEKYYYWAEQHCLSADFTSTYLIAHNFLMTARHLRNIGNGLRAEQYYARCIGICAQSDDNNLISTMNHAAMERAALIASMGAIEEAHKAIAMLFEYYLNKNQIYTIDYLHLLDCAISVVHYEEDFSEKLQLSKQALNIIPQIAEIDDSTTYTTRFRNALASSYIGLQQYENAIAYINEEIFDNRTSNTYWLKGWAERKLGLYNDAIQSWQQCLRLHNENEPIENILNIYQNLLVIAIESNTPIETQVMADDFISQVNKVVSITTSMDLNKMLPIYQIYYEFFLLYYSSFGTHADIAYNLAINLKGAALKSMQDFKNYIYGTQNRILIDGYENLRKLEKKLCYTTSVDDIEILRNKIYNLERNLLVELNNNPIPASFWEDVKANLERSAVSVEFVDYMISDSEYQYAALILCKDWDSPKMIPLCKKSDLDPLIKRLQDIYNSTSHRDSAESYIYKRLYSFVWSKLDPYLNEGDNVYFSPSGLLHQINVGVLKDAAGRQANEKYNLFRVSSTRELCMKKPVNQWKTAVLFGDLVYDVDSTMMLAQSRAYLSDEFNNDTASRGFVPDLTHRAGWSQLSNTAEEVNAIDRLLSSKRIGTAKYMQYAGNEESFKALSGKKTSIIHLATHGFFFKDEETKAKPFFEMLDMNQHQYRPDNSLKRSGLILAGGQRAWLGEPIPDNVEDGILLAEEIAAMDLSGTDLVVLSACETGLGEITSEGVFGLQRAFKKAGVQTLVMSLWKVHDAATSLMMRTFYKNLLDGKSKRDAFAMAQQTVKEKYENPYYWASFIMLD